MTESTLNAGSEAVASPLAESEAAGSPGAAPWTPRIAAVVCNWCTYAGADMAGTTRRAYPASVRMLRVPCSGRVNPLFILKAFERGADGVLVSGCHPGDCHYVQGNYFARRRFTALRALLSFVGLDPRRLHFSWVSASEGIKWAKVVDDVTKSVTEAGPLTDWGKPPLEAPPTLPAAGTAPRGYEMATDHDAATSHLRALAASLLREGKVDTVLGWARGSLPGRRIPTFVRSAGALDTLLFDHRCHADLAAYLAGPGRVRGKVAVLLKACDARAAAILLQEKKIAREDVVLVGVSCAGVGEDGRLAAKCWPCNGEVASLCDWTVSSAGVKAGAVASGAKRAVAPDPRDAQIAYLESRPAAERWAFWQEQFADCLRCYACRGVCPLCYCGSCVAEQHKPQWVPTPIDGSGNTTWNVIRAYHLAGRCSGCDECARVCPANIRLDLLNRRLAMEVEKRFGYRAGENATGAPPLAAFRPDDPQEFIY
ncbi:MAG: hydrogenase iron-sulfur subunit [bacterium]